MKYGEVRRGSIGYLASRGSRRSSRRRSARRTPTARSSSRMTRDSEAYDAGVRPGDVIVALQRPDGRRSVAVPCGWWRTRRSASTAARQGAARWPRDGIQAADRLERRLHRRSGAGQLRIRYLAPSACRDRATPSNSLNARLRRTGAVSPGDDFGGLVAISRHADDDRLVARDRAALNQIDRRRERRAAGRLGEDALPFPRAAESRRRFARR